MNFQNDIIESIVKKVLRRKIKFILDSITIEFNPEYNTVYELKFMLNCLFLPTNGLRVELIYRLIENNIEIGRKFHSKGYDMEFISMDKIVYHVDENWPVYMLKNLLKMKGYPATGDKDALLKTLKGNNIISGVINFQSMNITRIS